MNATPRVPAVHPFPATTGLTVLLAAFLAELGLAGAIVVGAAGGEGLGAVVSGLVESTTSATVWGFLAVAGAFVIALQVSWTSLSDSTDARRGRHPGTSARPDLRPGDRPGDGFDARLDDRLRRIGRFRWAALLAGACTLNAWVLALAALAGEPAVQVLTSLGMAGVVFFAVDAATVVLRFDTRAQLVPVQRRALRVYAALPARDRRSVRRHPRMSAAAGALLGIAWIAVIDVLLIATFVALVGAGEPQAGPARAEALRAGASSAALEIALTGALLVPFAIGAVALAQGSRSSTSRWAMRARRLAAVGSVLLLAPAAGFTVWLVVVLHRAGMPLGQALLLGAVFAAPTAIPLSALLLPSRASSWRLGPRASARLVVHGLRRADLESRRRRIRLLEAAFEQPSTADQPSTPVEPPAAEPAPPPPPPPGRSFTFTLVVGRGPRPPARRRRDDSAERPE